MVGATADHTRSILPLGGPWAVSPGRVSCHDHPHTLQRVNSQPSEDATDKTNEVQG